MRKLVFWLFLLAFPNLAAAADADWYERYKSLLYGESTDSLRLFIEQWEKAEGSTPDVGAAWFNYYITVSRSSMMTMSVDPPQEGVMALELHNDSTGEVAGYMYEQLSYNDSLLQLGYDRLNEAIARYPRRLDLPFGKITMLLQQARYEDALSEMSRLVDTSARQHDGWLWTLNEPVEDGDNVFRNSMQEYFVQLLDAEQDSLALCLAECMLSHYPHDIAFRSDKASLLAVKRDFATALPIYLSLLQEVPDDTIVISNVAFIYAQQGDKPNALKYYELLKEHGDEEERAFAEQAIRDLE